MRATLLLCDWAEVLNGKAYAQGIGWSRIRANAPVSFALVALIHVPYDQTNTKHTMRLVMETEDGTPFPAEAPVEIGADLEVGRPPGMRKGEESNVPLATKIEGLHFEPGGYVLRIEVNDETIATAPFTAV